jgi:hypothetical protein
MVSMPEYLKQAFAAKIEASWQSVEVGWRGQVAGRGGLAKRADDERLASTGQACLDALSTELSMHVGHRLPEANLRPTLGPSCGP